MLSRYKGSLLFLFLTLTSSITVAGPWFTGPILAPAGHTIPRGHTNLEIYGFFTNVNGVYDNNWNFVNVPTQQSNILNPLFTHGLTDTMDLQFSLPMAYNRIGGAHSRHIGDVSVMLGYQALEQNQSLWRPDLRITLQENIPTGRYEELIPQNNGADSTGIGAYQTTLNFNFQLLRQLSETHYLRTRLSLDYAYASNVRVHGITPYGSGLFANGLLKPGELYTVDLAGEFTLNQHWVAVMEGFFSSRGAASFAGFPGYNAPGVLAVVGNPLANQISLAPAMEYNFTSNVGLIAGVWFTLAGKNTSCFTSPVVALNMYW